MRFEKYWSHNEWFHADAELMQFIEALPPSEFDDEGAETLHGSSAQDARQTQGARTSPPRQAARTTKPLKIKPSI
jgi:hypothetical protein